MPIVAIEDGGATATPQYIMYIAPRKVKLADSYYYPSNSSVRITSEGTIATKFVRVDQRHTLSARVESYKNRIMDRQFTMSCIYIYTYEDEHNWVARFTLPKNLTIKQAQNIRGFLDKYFNN